MNFMDRIRANADRQEPTVQTMPQRQETTRQATKDFLDGVDRLREECAWLRSENEAVTRENKLLHERLAMRDSELTNLRADYDFLQRHDGAIMNSLENIVTLIEAAQAKARATAFAPPGTGTQTQPAMTAEEEAAMADLAKKLAPQDHQQEQS